MPQPQFYPYPVRSTLLLLSTVFLLKGQSAPLRCDIIGVPKLISDGSTVQSCLDLARLQGETLVLPKNATRFADQGLALCKNAVREGGLADIVYALDESGSMYANYLHVNPTTGDSTFLETLGGCRNLTAGDTVGWATIAYEESGTKTIRQLTSSKTTAGCNAFAGDPYGQRGVAFKNAIQYQSDISPSSTAGYLGFTDKITDKQTLLELTPANVQTLKDRIVMRSGGTYYRPPLDTAKRWLNTSSLIKTEKQAIIFLSDGKPSDTYLNLLTDGKMPPIYGIFLGNPTADFTKLRQLADSTRGKFYLIPPGDPDSLKAVVKIILNAILKSYTPLSATLRNESILPVQEAHSLVGDFTTQGDASWTMRLDEIVALAPLTSNAMSLETRFKEITSGQEEIRTTRFVIKTDGPIATESATRSDSLFALKCYDASQLILIDPAGRALSELTDRDSIPQVRLRTAPEITASQTTTPRSLGLRDSIAVNMTNQNQFRDSTIFVGGFPFLTGITTASKASVLEAHTFDTVTAHWQHPRDSQDTASLRVSVKASNRSATLRFSLSDGGPLVNKIPPDQTKVFLVLEDQPSSTTNRRVTVSSANLGQDIETITLNEVTPGKFQGQLQLKAGVKNPGDAMLQVSPGGDQLRAVYRDPDFGDSAVAQSGFDEAPQEPGQLVFIDGKGTVLPSRSTINPSEMAGLKVEYTDDYALGVISSKNSDFIITSSWGGKTVSRDQEKLVLSIQPSVNESRGRWALPLPLFETSAALSGDGRLNFRYIGELTAQVITHDNAGNAQSSIVTATLRLAYPDVTPRLIWKQMDTTGLGGGSVEGLSFTITDQDYAPGGLDSTGLQIFCPVSGDSLSLILAETTAGRFGPKSIGRNTGAANPSDDFLSCPDGSDILVRQVDPIFGTVSTWTIPQVSTPTADPISRDFRINQSITLATRTGDAKILYTLDASRPDTNNGLLYLNPIRIIAATTVKAFATKDGYRNSQVTTQVYTKVPNTSSIVILDINGNPLINHTLSDATNGLVIRLRTTQGGLSEVQPTIKSLRNGDVEEKRLLDMHIENDALVYQDVLITQLESAKAGNDTLSFNSEDTLVVFWKNPLDGNAMVSDTVIVRPRYFRPVTYFTDSDNGNRTNLYPPNQATLFITVDARPNLVNYNAIVSSSLQGKDSESILLTEITSGHYTGSLPLTPATIKSNGDGNMSVALAGDQLSVVFVDPIYHDTAIGNAGFAQGVEETGQLFFVDLNGKPLAPDAVYSPNSGKVFLVYHDDWSQAIATSVATKTVVFQLQQIRNGGIFAIDTEQTLLTLDTVHGSLGTWKGEFQLTDSGSALAKDGKLQTAFLGKLTATVATHSNAGSLDGGSTNARLTLTYPNQNATIRIVDEQEQIPSRPSREIHITLDDGPQITAGQPLVIKLTCAATGDSVVLQLKRPADSALWVGTVTKGEGKINPSDTILTCAINDQIIGTYQDPTHGGTQTTEVHWNETVISKLYFTRVHDSIPILSLSSQEGDKLTLHVLTQSMNRDAIDSLTAILTGPNGEKETVQLTETGVFTGHFTVTLPFDFSLSAPKSEDGVLGILINLKKDAPFAIFDAVQDLAKGSITLKTRVQRALMAAVTDQNRDGQADAFQVFLATATSEAPKPGVTAYWNRTEDNLARKVATKDLVLKDGGLSFGADLSANPWSFGVTGYSGAPIPMVRLPLEAPWFGQEVTLIDSVGLIPLKAIKKPSDLTSVVVSEYEKRFKPDTLVITLSEPLKSLASLGGILRFASGCTGYSQSLPVKTFGDPQSNEARTEWTVLVDNSPQAKLPLTGDCLYIETDGRYTDDVGNTPSPVGVKLEGENPRLAVRLVQGYPPVAGLDSHDPTFLVANSDSREDRTGRFTKESAGSWEVLWIPPANYSENNPMKSDIPGSPGEEPRETTGETTFPTVMPKNIGVVQVATTGRYIAQVSIFDNTGHFVTKFKQAFGYRGEMRNPYRSSDKGMLSFLVWDLKDSNGGLAGQGVYIWRILFAFADGKKEVQVVRTGLLRP